MMALVRGVIAASIRFGSISAVSGSMSTNTGLAPTRSIAVAVFTRGGSDRPRTIAQAARAIYDGFSRAFTWPFSGALTAQ